MLFWYKYKYVEHTNVGRYKGRTVQMSDVTNVILKNVGLLLTSHWYKRRTLVEFERKDHCYKKKFKFTHLF